MINSGAKHHYGSSVLASFEIILLVEQKYTK